VEREQQLGGNLRRIFFYRGETDPQKFLADLIQKVESDPRIKIYKGARINKMSGFLGNYSTEIIKADGTKEDTRTAWWSLPPAVLI
jgi:heterodisulfide reductase subunit A